VIDDKAIELGRLLGQTDEYKALKRAGDRLREDAEAQKQLAEVERLAVELERAARAGRQPSAAEVEAYERAASSIQGHPVYQSMVAAQANFEKLMTRVNERIYQGIQKGAASPIITLS
jgi:cell fate (sporulation/competence/biofilm development) regulator YlbF (YheA/YmcA/DUF963 family)